MGAEDEKAISDRSSVFTDRYDGSYGSARLRIELAGGTSANADLS